MTKKDIRALSVEDLEVSLKEIGEPAFRARQVHEWLWSKGVVKFDDMSNLSKKLREHLDANYAINAVEIHDLQVSSDKTIKCAMKLHDNYVVESVLIPHEKRM